MRFLDWLASSIDRVNDSLGRTMSWLVLATVMLCAVVAVLRYAFAFGWVWMQDAYLWANALVFMVGSGYTLLLDKHVRVDFVYGARSLKYKAIVNLAGSIVFLLPTGLVIVAYGLPYVRQSWARWEGAVQAGGMPALYLLKSVILISGIALIAQGISLAIRSYQALVGHPGAQSFYGVADDD